MNYDTFTLTIHQDELFFPDNESFDFLENQVQFLVNLTISKSGLGLKTQEKFSNFAVTQVIETIIYSKVAYIESENGYFFISEDMMEHIIITYSRWD